MALNDFERAIDEVIAVLEISAIPYHIGGSVASSLHGLFRTTSDIDIVADIRPEQVPTLVKRFQAIGYADDEMILDAILSRSSFNIIHTETGIKVDVFLVKRTPYDLQAFQRADPLVISESEDANAYFVAAPEDTILNKLRWYRLGGEQSERQWLDVLGVLKVQQQALDYVYLRHWAQDLGVLDLLESAIDQSTFP